MKHKSHSHHAHLHKVRKYLKETWQWGVHHKKKIVLIIGVAIGIWLVFVLSVATWYQQKHKNDPFEPGISFSAKYAKELGVDWRANYLALMDDLHFKHVRLMSYWDEIEPQPNTFSFIDLDWQMEQAAKRGVQVTLTIGKRQPRWPECHQPQWVDQLGPASQDVELINFLKEVVGRYKNSPVLESYQLENEIANRLFAPHCRTFDRAVLQEEVDTVKQIDNIHPLIINVSNQSGIPWRGPIGDKVGFSVYNIAYVRFGSLGYYYSFGWVPSQWHAFRAGLIELIHGKQSFVHELQTEPWGPAATKDLTLEEQNRSMNPARIKHQVAYAKQTGMHRMYLWGGEWWYWRNTQFNDPVNWETVREIVNENQQGN